MMKASINIKSIIILALIALMPTLQAQEMLDQYLSEAAENNPGLRARYNAYMAELEKIPQAGTLPDPKIGFGYFIQPVETRVGSQKAKFSASQMFPWFGTLGAKKDVMTKKALARKEAMEEAKSKLFYDVKVAFYNLYVSDRSIEIMQENIEILHTFREFALDKVETGQASAVDVIRVEIEISDLENQLALLFDMKKSQTVAFNNLLNVESNREVILPEQLVTPKDIFSSLMLIDSIREGNHRLQELTFLENSFLEEQDAARKAGLPGFSLGMDYILIGKSSGPVPEPFESGKDAIVFPTVGVTIPIYRKKYKAMVREAAYRQKEAANHREEKINTLERIMAETEKEYEDANRRIPLYELQSERASKVIRLLQSKYANEGADFEEILRMERQLLKYRLELEKARSDKSAAQAFVHYLMGKN